MYIFGYMDTLLHQWRQTTTRGKFAVLVDPDKTPVADVPALCTYAREASVDMWLVGSSLLIEDQVDAIVLALKTHSDIPVVLFPGSTLQITPAADALLLLSLISGRNADMLIGRHVEVAGRLASSQLELIPTGYMLIDGGNTTTAAYMSNTMPIPRHKPEVAAMTALAGVQLGLQAMYLDAGSGAQLPVPVDMIRMVRQTVQVPILVGGGIRTPEDAAAACRAGADIIVVGNALEQDPSLMLQLALAVHAGATTTVQ
jgi:putative glycerol-1-phosphate prenyltransferase